VRALVKMPKMLLNLKPLELKETDVEEVVDEVPEEITVAIPGE
jgi:hypothetical protein